MASLDWLSARAVVAAQLSRLGSERVSLLASLDRVSARDLCSDRALPPFDRITMDGYAVRAIDVAAASPQHPSPLKVIGAAYPGRPAPQIGPGECVRAMTGAALPAGADAIVPVEKTGGYEESLAQILSPVRSGQNIAVAGEDLPAGGLLVAAGERLRAAQVQALAACGHAQIEVFCRPRAVVFSTGDELVPVDRQPGPLQIRESNAATVRALFARAGIDCAAGGILEDRPEALRAALEPALAAHDLVVLSGGVSKGERDYVRDVLRQLGVELHFTQLQLRPGHPTTFGTRGKVAVFALPGNPVAVVATLCAIFGPGLRQWLGQTLPARRQWVSLDFETSRRGDRVQLLPVRLLERPGELPVAAATGHHGSGDFVSLARADGFAVLDTTRSQYARGERVEFLPAEI